MKTEDIKKMGLAYVQVLEANKKVNKHGHDAVGHEDDDIDNDGDKDKSDSYLHNRRKAISANIKKEEVEQIDEISKKTLGSYIKKASGNMAGNAALAAAQASSSMKKSSPEVKRNITNRMKGIARASDNLTKEDTTWPVFARIQEKRLSEKTMFKVSGVGDDPHVIETRFADDKHTKGAEEHEKIDSKASKGEKDFVNLHGGLDGSGVAVDGHQAAKHTASVATSNVNTAPGRHNDQKIGDKTMPKTKG